MDASRGVIARKRVLGLMMLVRILIGMLVGFGGGAGAGAGAGEEEEEDMRMVAGLRAR